MYEISRKKSLIVARGEGQGGYRNMSYLYKLAMLLSAVVKILGNRDLWSVWFLEDKMRDSYNVHFALFEWGRGWFQIRK